MRHKLLPLLLIAFTGLCSCDSSDVQTKPETETPAAQQGKPYVVTDEVKLKLTEAEETVRVVSSLIKSTQSRPTKDDLLLKIEPTLTTLESLDALLASTATAAPTDDIKEDLSAAQNAAKAAVSRLTDAKDVLAKKQKPELSDDERSKVTSGVTQSQNELANIKRNLTTAGTRTVLDSSRPPTESGGLFEWIVLGGVILGALILIALIVFGTRVLLTRTWAALDSRLARVVKATIEGVNQQQKDLSAKIGTLSDGHTEIKSRLTDIQFELKSVGRLVRDAPDRSPTTPEVSLYPSPAHSTAVNFPISVLDYVETKQRNGTVVRPDFQRGILVVDPANEAELMLVGDSDGRDGLLMVPRVGQFQTRQDFHTYFGKYYDCQHPTAGDVWIVSPAIVSTVPGGWQLREKGVLEVR